MNNLVTSCFECNRGKAARLLTIAPMSLSDKSKQIAEKEKQLMGYQSLIQETDDRLEGEAWDILEYLDLVREGKAYKNPKLKGKRFF